MDTMTTILQSIFCSSLYREEGREAGGIYCLAESEEVDAAVHRFQTMEKAMQVPGLPSH